MKRHYILLDALHEFSRASLEAHRRNSRAGALDLDCMIAASSHWL